MLSESRWRREAFCARPHNSRSLALRLIETMAALNERTVVVMTSGGGVDSRLWPDEVPGFLQTWYPGQGGGTAIAEILFCVVNPSGRLLVGRSSRDIVLEGSVTYSN